MACAATLSGVEPELNKINKGAFFGDMAKGMTKLDNKRREQSKSSGNEHRQRERERKRFVVCVNLNRNSRER